MSDAWSDWARLTRERDAALAQVERLRAICKELHFCVVAGHFGDTNMVVIKRRDTVMKLYERQLQGDGT
jgi:hypothetical protein